MATTKKRKKMPPRQTKKQQRQAVQKRRMLFVIISLVVLLVASIGAYYLYTRQSSDAISAISCKYTPSSKIKSDQRLRVNGYFIFTASDQCQNRKQMHEMKNTGARNVITFGSRLVESSPGGLRSSSEFRNFTIGGRSGYDHALRQTDGGKIRAVYTYSNRTSFSKAALNCGKRNGVQINGNRMYTWWLFPVNNGYSDCTDSKKTYDLVVAYNSDAKNDADRNVIANARQLGMQAYLGLPWPKADRSVTYVADRDRTYRHTYGAFITRMIKTWNERYASHAAFAGTYATLEMPIGGKQSIWQSNMDTYRLQSQVLGWHMRSSKRTLIVSPFADVKNHPLSQAEASMKAIVRHAKVGTGVRVIMMPQDGVGTGLVPLNQTTRLYQAARKSGAWRTWANLEAFSPPRDSKGVRLPTPRDGNRFAQQFNNARKAGIDTFMVYRWDHVVRSKVFER